MIILSYLIIGCATDWENQSDFLLPSQNQLKLIDEEETIMATINQYSVSGAINQDSLVNYPLNQLEGKAIKKWHRATEQEIHDLQKFFEEEPITEDVGNSILQGLQSDKSYLAYMYNFDQSAPALEKGYAHRDHEAIPGEKGYVTANWVDIYYLNEKDGQLIHISYGKF